MKVLLLSVAHSLAKARVSERTRLESVLARSERRIRDAFVGYLADARSPASLREVRELLEANRLSEAVAVVDAHVVPLGRVIPTVFSEVAAAEAKAAGQRWASGSRLAALFDPSNETAAALMRQNQLKFVRDFTTSQREALRAALANSFAEGESPRVAAQAMRDAIGLTRGQVESVSNYRRLLENNSREALSRALRDRRSDRVVERAVEEGEPLEGSKIDRMVERYRANMLSNRADTIARTEGLRTVNEARYEATRQVLDDAGIDPKSVKRTWRATRDKRTRDSHADMDGQTVGLDEPFISGLGNELWFPGDGPPADAINCRCVVTMTVE